MLKRLIAVAVLASMQVTAAFAQSVQRPKLVVGVVLDQMRWDYLHRYAHRFGEGGFKRLMKYGFNCQNTTINYLPSYTAPGHASVYTGSVPALHGITANDWWMKSNGAAMYCTQDDNVRSVDSDSKAGKMSPRNLQATTVADELRLATNFQSKTIGIALKDRGAILPVGHTANAAYWFDSKDGRFISSTYYMDKLPEWLQQFNQRNVVDSLLGIPWNTQYPINTYTQSTADKNEYEAGLGANAVATFPYQLDSFIAKDKGIIRSTPWGNTLTRLMAEAAIRGEQLGKGKSTDFIAISFSATDYIGHIFGPNSIEVEDCYIRMDKELELLLKFLDNYVGEGNYTLFLTADHGGAHNVSFLADNKIPAGNFENKKIGKELNNMLKERFGSDKLVKFSNYQVYTNDSLMQSMGVAKDELLNAVIAFLKKQDHIAFVLDMTDMDGNVVPRKVLDMAINAHHPKRSGDIQIILDPGHYSGYGPKGTTHGSWNPYDTRIPLLFYGWGVKKGSSYRPYHMTDIAPTIAALLHIQEPNACIGTPIVEVMKTQ